MEKLLKYLNECEKERYSDCVERRINDQGKLVHGFHLGPTVSEMKICIKEYGYIERLTNNNKIDFEKLLSNNWYQRLRIGGLPNGCDSERYYTLLMMLAVQDNPIRFLISILK